MPGEFKAVWWRRNGVRIEFYIHSLHAYIITPMNGYERLTVTFEALYDLFGAPSWE